MFVKVFKLGAEDNIVTVFRLGVYIVGRGPVLQCDDKRVSRNHATIEVTNDVVKITANHVNPCFIKLANSKTITMLQKGETVNLNDEDTFALLPDTYWFKVRIEEEMETDMHEEEVKKRHINDVVEEETQEKRQKMEENNKTKEGGENGTGALNTSADETTEVEEKPVDNTTCEASTSKIDEAGNKGNEEINEEDKEQGPSTSGNKPKSRRERCWYGAQCFRKNPIHRQDFTHPGDSDFESDPEDDRPSCSFGAACYRKNKLHRREYKHPPREPPKHLPSKGVNLTVVNNPCCHKCPYCKRKDGYENDCDSEKRVGKKVVADPDDADLSDMSEDPFIDDGGSDEYQQDTDADDTDWEDSQNADEDSENVKNLVKEAKRFIKK